MSRFFDAIRRQTREDGRPRQSHSHGVVAGVDRGRYRVVVGGQTHLDPSRDRGGTSRVEVGHHHAGALSRKGPSKRGRTT